MEILEKMENIKKRLLYDFSREKFLSDVIGNIGEIVEDEKCITCVVDQELLNKYLKPDSYMLYLYGMGVQNKKIKDRIKYFNLDKPVHYIFNGIKIYAPIMISSSNCDVEFVNCSFCHSYIKIFAADKITFEGNKYYDLDSVINGNAFIRTSDCGKVGELNFKNENFVNKSLAKDYYKAPFGINVSADKINIINSIIKTDLENGQISMKSKDINIKKSEIESPKIYLNGYHVDVDRKSRLIASRGIIVGNDKANCDVDICINDIYSPYVVFNGAEFVDLKSGNMAFYQDTPKDLHEERVKFVNLLRNIKMKSDSIVDEKVMKVKEQVEKKSLKQLIKK